MPAIDAPLRVWAYIDPREVDGDATAFAAAMRRYGVAAVPDLTVDDWDRWAPAVSGMTWVPVRLPDDVGEWDAAVRTWVARLAGTGQRPFAIPIDEPRRLWQKLVVRERAAQVRAAGQGAFIFAVTDEPTFVYGDLIDLYISPFAPKLAHPDPDRRWTYNGTAPIAGSMILDTDAIALRTWGWIGWRWQVPVWYVWNGAYWHDKYHGGAETDADHDAVSFDDGEDHGNLDGVLAWWKGGALQPTLRLEALRRGLQDRALLELYERCVGRAAADAIARSLVPVALGDADRHPHLGAWPLDEASWEAARGRLLDALAQVTPSGRCR